MVFLFRIKFHWHYFQLILLRISMAAWRLKIELHSFALCGFEQNLIKQIVFNSLAPGKFEWNFRHVICKQILVIDGWGISCEITLLWMSLDFIDDQSTLVQVMAWCRPATSHYLSQCWPRFLLPYGVTRPQNGWWHLPLLWALRS